MNLPVALVGGGTALGLAALLLAAPGLAPRRLPHPVGGADRPAAPSAAGRTSPGEQRAARRPHAAWHRPLRFAVGAAVLAVVSPALVPPAAFAIWAIARQRAVRSRRRLEHAIRVALPDAVDLLLLCCGAGLSLPLAHPQVAVRVPGPVGEALRTAAISAEGGHARADALVEALGALSDRAASLGDVLVDHLRYGAPLLPALERLSAELRLDRRRHAEESARRVPVRLLGPLIACTLPAFGVLTVVPLVAASLQALPT